MAQAINEIIDDDGKTEFVVILGDYNDLCKMHLQEDKKRDEATQSWPMILKQHLAKPDEKGKKKKVLNLSKPGASIIPYKDSNSSLSKSSEWATATQFKSPSSVILDIGREEAFDDFEFGLEKETQFKQYLDSYVKALKKSFGENVYLMVPPPILKAMPDGKEKHAINGYLPYWIAEVGKKNNAKLIDVFNPLGGYEMKRPKFFDKDLIHTNVDGDKLIADIVAKNLEE